MISRRTQETQIEIPTAKLEDLIAAHLYATRQIKEETDVDIYIEHVDENHTKLRIIQKEEVKVFINQN